MSTRSRGDSECQPSRKRSGSPFLRSGVESTNVLSYDADNQTSASRRNVVLGLFVYKFSEPMFTRSRNRLLNRSSLSVSLVGTSSVTASVHDLGDCSLLCEFCGALFWKAERLASFPATRRPRYTQCCKVGTVRLCLPRDPLAQIKHLLERQDYLEGICAYNSMFAMTSFGAKVDRSINSGSAPYVFKVEGQISHWLGSLCPSDGQPPRFLQMYIYDTDNEIRNRMQHFGEAQEAKLSEGIVRIIKDVLDINNELVKIFWTARDVCSSDNIVSFDVCLYRSGRQVSYDRPAPNTMGAIVHEDLYTIEFQKRGLPHCHMLFWVSPADKIITADDVDRHISSEIPNPNTDPELYKIVSECMIHGPCGLARPNAPCVDGGVCSKGFPKLYQASTTFDKNGYIKYKRSAYEFSVKKNDIEVDNAYVVPYNRTLSLLFNAHINVEYCGWNMMIKYLFKYVSKGSDRIHFKITQSIHKVDTDQNSLSVTCNEIDNFVDGRFICPHEAAWRIFNFPIHHRYPAVQVLAVHLENMQNVGLSDQQKLLHVVNNPCVVLTTLTEWFATNAHDPSGRHLRYIDFLSEYRWEGSGKCWIRRLNTSTNTIGRLAFIHPSSGESFFLRMLLNHQTGCKSFADVRTVDGVIYDTYRSACEKLGLLVDDNEWLLALDEAKAWATPKELRALFAHILLHCEVANH
ncbi:uncharacterized protein LOC143584446 [Bidens hawaiensis]|uniref:uncharacterized protein LOC143584446 n=1 Tax=Bidens hawaiensis TaxID=980011 RepID=UPI00404907F4